MPRDPPRRSRTRSCRRARRRRSRGRPRGRRRSSSPCRVARCSAAAATVSAPAMAKRALTPERWSTEVDSRRSRVKRARISTRWSGTSATSVGLLPDHRDLVLELGRVVGADLGAEAVLERGDDPAAVGVVLRVGAGHDEHVERQPQHVAADLDVALLHHVEHRHLDPLGEVGQLVDRDDAAVAARDQPEVDGLGVAEAAALGDLHRVDVTDQVGDAACRGSPASRRTARRGAATRPAARRRARRRVGCEAVRDRLVGVLAELGAVDHRRPLVEQADQRAQQPGLALAALTEEHDVVPGDQGPLELRDDRVVEAVQARPGVAALARARRAGCRGSPARRGFWTWPDSRSWPRVRGVGASVIRAPRGVVRRRIEAAEAKKAVGYSRLPR